MGFMAAFGKANWPASGNALVSLVMTCQIVRQCGEMRSTAPRRIDEGLGEVPHHIGSSDLGIEGVVCRARSASRAVAHGGPGKSDH